MIRSSLFPIDDTSEWDLKSVRQCLFISEDQLKILNKLPEWSKADGSSEIVLEQNSSLLNSQNYNPVSQLSQKSKKVTENRCLKNRYLFYKDLELRKEILQTYKLRSRKRNKSSSIIECLRSYRNTSKTVPLRKVSSSPALNTILYNKRLYSESPNSDKVIPLSKTLLSSFEGRSKDIFSDPVNTNSSHTILSYSVKVAPTIMEVITQLPVNVPCGEKDSFTIQVQNKEEPMVSQVASTPLCGLKDDEVLEPGEIKTFESFPNGKQDKTYIGTPDANEIHPKSIETSSNPFLLLQNSSSANVIVNDGYGYSKLLQANIVCPNYKTVADSMIVKPSGNLKPSVIEQENCMQKEVNDSNPQGNNECNNTQIIQHSNQNVEVANILSTKIIPSDYVAVKRKSDLKKSSKKHKHMQVKRGNVKKAESIMYSSEEINSMLTIVKQFLNK